MKYEKQGRYLIFTDEKDNKMRFDLVENTFLKIYANGKEKVLKNPNVFFSNRFKEIYNLLDKDYSDLIRLIKIKESNRLSNIGTILGYISKYQKYESWIKMGYYNYVNDISEYNIKAPNELPKSSLKLIKELIDNFIAMKTDLRFADSNLVFIMKHTDDIELILNISKYLLNNNYFNNITWCMNTISWSFHRMKKCIIEFGCDYKTLIDYIYFKITVMENYGSSLWHDYEDYLTMQSNIIKLSKNIPLEESVNNKLEKYPKFLKSQHDIMVRIYNNYKQEYNELLFSNALNKELEIDKILNKKYKVVLPKETLCLKNEGVELKHCVGTYIDKIINNECQVVFLRDKDKLDESLLTIDIRNGMINQVEGYGRRNPNEEELKAIYQYAKLMNLKINKNIK